MELRYTDTNASDDSAGKAFGLDGNLYVPLVIAFIAGIGATGLTALLWQVNWGVAVVIGLCPVVGVVSWIVGLKQGRPAGYDRDWLEHVCGQGNFTRANQPREDTA